MQKDLGRMSGNDEAWAWCYLAVYLVVEYGISLEEARSVVNLVRYPG